MDNYGYFIPWNEYSERIQKAIIRCGVTSIGDRSFEDCSSLASVTPPESMTEAFSGCDGLTSVMIPKGVTSIGNRAFGCSSLTSVTIPEGVTSIGDSAFEGCSSLTSVTIPEGVTSIGDSAFYGCRRPDGYLLHRRRKRMDRDKNRARWSTVRGDHPLRCPVTEESTST